MRAGSCSPPWATAWPPRSARRGSAATAAIEAQRHFAHGGLACAWACTPARFNSSATTYRGRALNRAARIMAVGHGGQILVSDLTADFLQTGPRTGRSRRPGAAPTARSGRARAHLAGGASRRSTATSRRCEASTRSRTTCRSSARSSSAASDDVVHHRRARSGASRRHADRSGRRRQDPPRGAGRRREAHGTTSWFVSLAGVDDANDVLGAIAATARSTAPATRWTRCRGVRIPPSGACPRQLRARRRGRRRSRRAVDRGVPQAPHPRDEPRSARLDGRVRRADSAARPSGDALELFELRANASGAPMSLRSDRWLDTSANGSTVCRSRSNWRRPASRSLGLPAIVDALDDRFWLLSGGRRTRGRPPPDDASHGRVVLPTPRAGGATPARMDGDVPRWLRARRRPARGRAPWPGTELGARPRRFVGPQVHGRSRHRRRRSCAITCSKRSERSRSKRSASGARPGRSRRAGRMGRTPSPACRPMSRAAPMCSATPSAWNARRYNWRNAVLTATRTNPATWPDACAADRHGSSCSVATSCEKF